MRSELLTEIAALEEQEQIYKSEIERIEQTSPMDMARYSAYDDELKTARKKLEEKRAELAREEEKEKAIEEKIHKEAVPFAIEGVDFKTLPTSLIKVVELVVKADRKRIFAEHAVELEQVENERDDWGIKHKELVYEYAHLKEDYDTCARELKEQTEETVRLISERDDARANRDNAAAQLAEANAEIARLKSEIDDYQKAKAYGEREAQSIIDVNPNDAEEINNAIKEFLNAEDWGSIIKVTKPDETFELVKREEFNAEWQKITPPSLGGSDNAAETFQGEGSEGDVINGGISAPEAPSLDFRGEEEESTTNGLGGGESSAAGSVVTREEVEARFQRIEEHLGLKSWRSVA